MGKALLIALLTYVSVAAADDPRIVRARYDGGVTGAIGAAWLWVDSAFVSMTYDAGGWYYSAGSGYGVAGGDVWIKSRRGLNYSVSHWHGVNTLAVTNLDGQLSVPSVVLNIENGEVSQISALDPDLGYSYVAGVSGEANLPGNTLPPVYTAPIVVPLIPNPLGEGLLSLLMALVVALGVLVGVVVGAWVSFWAVRRGMGWSGRI